MTELVLCFKLFQQVYGKEKFVSLILFTDMSGLIRKFIESSYAFEDFFAFNNTLELKAFLESRVLYQKEN